MTDDQLETLLAGVARYVARYRLTAGQRPHRPVVSYAEARARFDRAMPDKGLDPEAVVQELCGSVDGALANMTGPRFFGWVIGASSPAGVAADWLTSGWGQNTCYASATPGASACEEVAARWLLELMDLPRESSVGFVTGGTMANFTCLAAARGAVLRNVGWDVDSDGLFGAPPIHVVLGEEAHSTVFSALRYLGLGERRVIVVPADAQGRMRADAFAHAIAPLDGPIIAIAQAGHINSGAFDPVAQIVESAHEKGAWLHVDGAIGLWACGVPALAELTTGIRDADSWGADGHKWLQTPHDCGYAIVRDAEAHRRAMVITASYLPGGDERHPVDYVPELSRRARGFATWAMLRHLGREGVVALIERHRGQARRMAARLAREPGIEILNDVVLNQVAVALDADEATTKRTIDRVQRGGVCFVGGASWLKRSIIRVSVTSENTTDADIDMSADAIIEAWRAERSTRAEQ